MAVESHSIQVADGIIEMDVEYSIDNLCRLGNQGWVRSGPEYSRYHA